MVSDRRALSEFDAAYPRLVTAAFHAAGRFFRFDESQVEDVVAETMARTCERWERVRRHDKPEGWVVVCAKNVCLEHLRARSRWTAVDALDAPPAPDESERLAVSAEIAAALGQLTRRQRDVAVLRYFMDLDESETAAAMGTSVSKVRTAAHEARARLRVLLANFYGSEDVSA